MPIQYSDSAYSAGQSMAQQIRNRDRDYRWGIQTTQEQAVQFASLLTEMVLDEDIRRELDEFMTEQKQRLVKIAEDNVLQERRVNAFCAALSSVQQEVRRHEDYERALKQEMKKAQENTSMNLDMHQEPMVREVQTALGFTVQAADSDLEIMPQTTESLKCPISGALFDEPVRNKICKHVYSKESLRAYLQQRRGRNSDCPVVGCQNSHLTMDSCVADKTIEFKVRRLQRKEAHQHEVRMSQAVDCEDEDDEEVAEFYAVKSEGH